MSDLDGSCSSSESDVESAGENPPNSSERGAVKDGKAPRKSRQSPGSAEIIKELRRMESALSASIQRVSRRVDRLEGAPPAKRQVTVTRHGSDTFSLTSWVDHEDGVASVPPPQWSGSEEEKRAKSRDGRSGAPSIVELSEDNVVLISSAFTTVLQSAEWKRV